MSSDAWKQCSFCFRAVQAITPIVRNGEQRFALSCAAHDHLLTRLANNASINELDRVVQQLPTLVPIQPSGLWLDN